MSGGRQRERRRAGGGTGRIVLLGAVAMIALGATFAAGLYLGRHSTSRPGPAADAEAPRKSPVPRRSGLVEPVAERRPAPREPLTFYQTLTAPLAPLPTPARASTAAGRAGEPAAPRPAPDVRPAAASPQVGPSLAAAASEWTVQVGVFRDRRQAESLKKQLADGGIGAHLVDTRGEDGQIRHRVRVGSFRTRDEAARVAARVASERRVPTYVTLR